MEAGNSTSRLSRYKARRREQLGQSSLDFNFESTTANYVFMQREGHPPQTVTVDFRQPDELSQQFVTPANMGSAAPELETRCARPRHHRTLRSAHASCLRMRTVPGYPRRWKVD